ncbi:MAG: fused MFS/spermidine synthase [Nitrospirae bacterium]|nr:fused MFS/spermidine synthase [Nitrospirota bacterium]
MEIIFCVGLLIAQSKTVSAEAKVLYEGDSIYNHIRIDQDGEERCMLFGRYKDKRQTCINMSNPDVSIFEYTGMMFVGFLFHPDSRDVALIGLGGGYVPSVFSRNLPSVRIDSIEVDPLVYKLAQKYFSLKATPMQTFTVLDGRQYLKKTERKYDQIWVDAFNTDYIPVHLTTKEFLQLAKSRLTKNGIVVQNVHNANKLFDAQVATFRAIFSNVFVFNGKKSRNAIIVASDNPLYKPSNFKQSLKNRVKIGEINLKDEAYKYDPTLKIAKTSVLTDDYNPANFLLHQDH